MWSLIIMMLALTDPSRGDVCEDVGGQCSPAECCPYGYYSTGSICVPGQVCCMHPPDCQWAENTRASGYWPAGDFAIPQTVYDCPMSAGMEWNTGYLSLGRKKQSDTLNQGSNSWSLEYHGRGPYSPSLLTLTFCVGLENFRNPGFTTNQPEWPAGSYCIFQIGDACPTGFASSNVSFPTDMMEVDWVDPVPMTTGQDDVTLKFCCRQDAEASTPIQLPTPSAFALIKIGDICQQVQYLMVSEQYFELDLSPLTGDIITSGMIPNITGQMPNHLRLPLCYYQEYETCYLLGDSGSGYTGHINYTTSGDFCESRDEFEGHIRFQYTRKSPTNYCANYGYIRTHPACLLEVQDGGSYPCGVPACDFKVEDYRQVSEVMPIRAKKETADYHLGVDRLSDTCTRQSMTLQAWYQINMMRSETVVAVVIIDNSGHRLCFVRLANVYVGLTADDFQDDSAIQCRHNFTINGDNYQQVVRCVEPARGQYVTLASHVYRHTDMSYGQSELDDVTNCLHICEFHVYVENDSPDCGIPLKSSLANLQVSSTDEGRASDTFWLYHHTAWCATMTDTQPFVVVDMLWSRRVEGLWTQGDADSTGAMVTSFTMEYGASNDEMFIYLKDPSTAHIFECPGDSHTPVRHQFTHSIIARYLKLNIVTWDVQPCLRLKPIVCKEELRMMRITSASASTVYINELSLVYDGQLSTCASTLPEPSPWLALHLSATVLVKAVIIDTSPYYVCDPEVLSDYGEEYMGLVNTSDGYTCQRWDSQLPHKHVNTAGSDFPEDDLSRAENYCRNPDVSAHVWCYTTDDDKRWIYCDIPACEPVRLDVHVGSDLDMAALEAGWSPGSLCDSIMHEEPGTPSQLTVNCVRPTSGNTVLLTTNGPYDTAIDACEIFVSITEVFVRPRDTASLDSSVHHLACTEPDHLYMWFTQTPNYDVALVLPISPATHTLLPDQCPLYSRECSLPTERVLGQDTVYGHFGCVSRELHGWQEYNFELSDPGPVITSLFYFDVYDSISTTSWRLQAPADAFIIFLVRVLKLAPSESYWIEDNYKTDPGRCHDHVEVVYYTDDTGNILYTSEVLSEQYETVSSSSLLTVQLHTCYHYETILLEAEIDSAFNFTECAGCYAQSSCSGGDMSCSTPCGYIIPQGYPASYQPYTSCLWRITVNDQAYVKLSFVDFDIFEDILPPCPRDMVTVKDVSKSGTETSLGSFCNTFKPPEVLYSSWNHLVLEFVTDAELQSSGFKARYDQLYHEISGDLVWDTNSDDCETGWTLFGESCYKLFQHDESLPWDTAESICVEAGGHLTSVMDVAEMQFIQYIMTGTRQEGDIEAYIGLQDKDGDGNWRWLDGSPLVYSNWYKTDGISQPDGGTIEACSSIRLQQLRFHKNWHDIPCATTDTNLFICKLRPTHLDNIGRLEPPSLTVIGDVIPSTLFRCVSGEYLLQIYQCDGLMDCRDGSDEGSMCAQLTHQTECAEFSFRCSDGACISMSLVCDIKRDCEDGSDESHCVYSECVEGEWRCDSGACIPETKHCDLIQDCDDGSDETTDCFECREDAAFQCYDGSCIPRAHLCDGTVDCMVRQEDEALSICGDEVQIRSCKQWRMLGHDSNGIYQISLEGGELVNVECEMDATPTEVATVIHNNLESPVYVDNYEAQASYQRNLSYTHAHHQIALIKNISTRCDQWFEFICVSADGLDDWYLSFSGVRRSYHREEDEMVDECECRLQKSCQEGENKCWCSKNNKAEWIDRGYFRDDDVYHDDVPILGLSLSDTGQPDEYIYYTAGPLKCYQEYEQSDVIYLCNNGQSYTSSERCMYEMDEYDIMEGCRDATHLQNCEEWQCPVGYAKCPSGYCIGYWRVCDGVLDCAGGEDEIQCESHECSGMLTCRDGVRCLDLSQRCDGIKQCPSGEDEQFCSITCPDGCQCQTLSIWCPDLELTHLPGFISPEVRLLDLSYNIINMSALNIASFKTLIHLDLSYNGIQGLISDTFHQQYNLRFLDLSYNQIKTLNSGCFSGLLNLQTILLTGNDIQVIESGALSDLKTLPELSLSSHQLETIQSGTFEGMDSLLRLDLSYNQIFRLEPGVFAGLGNMQYLKMDNNRIGDFQKVDFAALVGLDHLISDDYMFCCFVDVPAENCWPEKDAISSCSDLMSNNGLRVLLWILGITSLIGNLSVITFRFVSEEKMSVSAFLVTNLHISDCLMGVYLVILAGVDLYYEGRYIENSLDWRNSGLCKFTGAVATISSEMSVLTLCIITGDRLINIRFSFTEYKLRLKSASVLVSITWIIVVLMAVIPLFPSGYFQDQFYSRSGVCVSIHLTDEVVPGWEYSVAIFHLLNFTTFVFIFLTYSYIFNFVKASSTAASAQLRRKREMAAARQMTLVVASDFLCWVPINIMGAMALSGVQIPGDVYAWIVVLVLPLNSALNPILYTISTIRVKRAQQEQEQSSMTYITKDSSIFVRGEEWKSDDETELREWIDRQKDLSLRLLLAILKDLAKTIASLQEDGLTMGKWSSENIRISTIKGSVKTTVSCNPILTSICPEGVFEDIDMFGQVARKLLKMYTISKKNR